MPYFLTRKQVIEIKKLIRDTDLSDATIAKRYNKSSKTVKNIRTGKTHSDVTVKGFAENTRNKYKVDLNTCIDDILYMRDSLSCSFIEIAKHFKCSVNSIRNYYQKGLEKQYNA